MKYCECGCGIEITKLNKHRGTIKRFIHGHKVITYMKGVI